MRLRFTVLLLALALAQSVHAQVPGCVNGTLSDPRAYVQSLEAGKPALETSLSPMQPSLAKYGIDVQHDSGGHLRGRIFLPSGGVFGSDFAHAVDIIDGSVSPSQWVYVDRGGPYVPASCGSVDPPPPSGDLAARVTTLEQRVSEAVDRLGAVEFNSNEVARILFTFDTRIKVLESHPIPTSCSVPILGCRLR